MIDLFTLICVIIGLCLLRIIFSDGFEKGFLMLLFISSFFGLPMYFMIKLDSGWGVITGLLAAALITFTVGDLFDDPKRDQIIFIKDRTVTKWLIRSKDDIKTARFMLKKYEVV